MYHVLENNRVPCSSEVIPPDPNAPELPPPLEPDSQDNDTPPVYQDIAELSCKPNKLVDCNKKDEQCQHGEHLLNTDSDNMTLTDEKVHFYFMFLCACLHMCWQLPSNQSFYTQIAGYGMGVGDHMVG